MTRVNIYPDPFTSRISVEVTSQLNENAIVCMLNEEDKIIKMFSWQLKPGTNKTSIEGLETLPSGDYHISMKDINGTVFSMSVIHKA